MLFLLYDFYGVLKKRLFQHKIKKFYAIYYKKFYFSFTGLLNIYPVVMVKKLIILWNWELWLIFDFIFSINVNVTGPLMKKKNSMETLM